MRRAVEPASDAASMTSGTTTGDNRPTTDRPTTDRNANGSDSASNGSARSSPNATPVPSTGLLRESIAGKHVCPFCGQQNSTANEPCSRCTMEDTAATRQATKARIGPWYVLQTRNPAAPGMKFSTLISLVGKGQVTPRSVVRGPTTHQLWRFAAHVRGLSREFGICYSCGEAVEKTASICPHCDRAQDPPTDPDTLLEPRGNASAVLGGATGNSHFASHRRAPSITPPAHNPAPNSPSQQTPPQQFQTHEFEIPQDPPAYVAPTPPRRGEHSERLRVFNQELTASRSPRVELARRDVRGANVSSTALATAFQVDPDELEGGTGGFRRAVATLFVLALIGSGIYFYLNPESRRKTGAWIEQRLEQARAKSGDRPMWDPAPAPPVNRSPVVNQTGSDRINAGSVVTNSNIPKIGEQAFVVPRVPTNPAPSPSTQPTTAPSVVPDASPNLIEGGNPKDALANNDSTTATPPPAADPAPAEAEVQKPAQPRQQQQQQADADTKSAANRRTSPPQRTNEQIEERTPILTDDQAIERSRKLWQRAIDAEVKGDFAEAVRCYEDIKNLPRVAHQANLDFRLNNAKRRAGR